MMSYIPRRYHFQTYHVVGNNIHHEVHVAVVQSLGEFPEIVGCAVVLV